MSKNIVIIPWHCLVTALGWLLIVPAAFSQNPTTRQQDFIYKSVDGHDIRATIYLPEPQGAYPVLIYFHGGSFTFGNREQGLEQVLKEKLLANNIAIVSADYRLAPETKLGDIMQDARDMVTWIKANGQVQFNVNPNRIVVGGGSAGGYLALSTGFDPESAPAAIVSISSPTGFSTKGIQTGDLNLLKIIKKDSIVSYGDYSTRMDLWRYLAKNGLALYAIFGFDPVKEPQKLTRYTLTNNIKDSYPPILIIHAKNDRLVKFDDAVVFHKFLQDQKIETELYVVDEGHSSDLINRYPDAIDRIVLFLQKQFSR